MFRYRLVDFLIEKGYWQPLESAANREISAYYSDGWGGRGHYGAAGRMLSRGNQSKMDWTVAHPELAEKFWCWMLLKIRNEPEPESYLSDDIWMCVQECKDFEEFKMLLINKYHRDDLSF
jgi:hypothetical protein